MNKSNIGNRIICLMLLGGIFTAEASAQKARHRFRKKERFEMSQEEAARSKRYNLDYVTESDAWLGATNAAGLTTLPVWRVAVADIGYDKSGGGFINYSDSDDSYKFGVSTRSYLRIDPSTNIFGSISYESFEGKNMTGSYFIAPYLYPLDIVEEDITASSNKKRENYNLSGGVGYRFDERWSVGGRIDYAAASYAKMKDLRHENYMLDMTVTAGASCRLGGSITLGANYIYRRSVEAITCNLYGNIEKQYYSIIDYGAFYGNREALGDSGYTDQGDSQPMSIQYHGGALQAEVRFSPQWSLFNEAQFSIYHGAYGKRGTISIVFTEFEGTKASYAGTLVFNGGNSLHKLSIEGTYDNVNNNENIYRRETSSGGVSNIVYYGSNRVLTRSVVTANVEYKCFLGIATFNPVWTITAGACLWQRNQDVVPIYPYYRKQDITSIRAYASAEHNLVKAKNMFTVRLGAGYGTGSGTVCDDGVLAQPSPSSKQPVSADQYLYKEFEYLTAPRVNVSAGVRYTHFFKSLSPYADLGVRYTKALAVEHLSGDSFAVIGATIGCNF